ncbi:MAG: hypothetical protein AAF479_12830 [Pseudomonadota bacterium]
MATPTRSVLFVCTGNIFRSLTAERALRRALGAGSGVAVASAGTASVPDLRVRGDVVAYLSGKGLDVSDHQRRTLTAEIVQGTDLVVAMNSDHRRFLSEQFGVEAPLYTAAVGGEAVDLPDVNDLFRPEDYFTDAAMQHVRDTIDRIVADAPALGRRLSRGEI